MAGPRPMPGLDGDELASDVAYSAATVALSRAQQAGPDGRPWSTTQTAGVAVTAAAPYIARDLLRVLADEPWWRRWRLLAELLAGAEIRIAEQGVIR